MRLDWSIKEASEDAIGEIVLATGLSPITARLLVSRGVDTPEKVSKFLSPDISRDWLDPFLIAGLKEVADVTAEAIRNSQIIAIFGDFDVDGISSTALLTRALRSLGATVFPFLPKRFDEGYGLSELAIERVLSCSPDLVITVDSGVSSADEVKLLVDKGVKVAVTDHHEPSDAVPSGIPIADPKLDPNGPSQALAGAGVALKLVQALGILFGKDDLWRDYTDLASMGTIADLMPLESENRALVSSGVALLQTAPRPGIIALAAVCGLTPEQITANGMSFSLIPRLNAAGRMGDPTIALELLLTDDFYEAERIAAHLDSLNKERRDLENKLSAEATALLRKSPAEERLVLVAGEGWHEGVKGIVASQLAGKYNAPSLVFTIMDGIAKGSGRSVGNVDLFSAIESASDLVIRFGGHKAAVGVTLEEKMLPEFKARVLEHLAHIPSEDFECKPEVDAVVRLEELSLELMAEFDLLRPFGQSNKTPLLAVENVFMNNKVRVGHEKEHLRFSAYDGAAEFQAIAFRCGDIDELATRSASVDVVFEPTVDSWRGNKRLQLFVRTIIPNDVIFDSPAADLVESLFEKADDFLAKDEYAFVEDANSFYTKLAGVTFEGRQDEISALAPGLPLKLVREASNQYDANACAVHSPSGVKLGYVNRRLAGVLAPLVDSGTEYEVELTNITGGTDGASLGVNVLISKTVFVEEAEGLSLQLRDARMSLEKLEPQELEAEIARRFIGDLALHKAQKETLDALATGESVLTVMATGRGKSLIFHLHAAKTALLHKKASVFVYPLRALVADQAFHLNEAFAHIGLMVKTITGESSQTERDEAFEALGDGSLDVVLTTPEFLNIHSQRFAETNRIGFFVVDEAHHVGMSRKIHRPTYALLGETRAALGNPTVLAVTATAGDQTAATIQTVLGIHRVILDPTVRTNLELDDRRNQRDKDGYLTTIVSSGEKTVIYVNSREQSVRIAKMLRKRVPSLGHRIAFYHGGLTRSMRNAVEVAFREDELSVVIATSAFGEGVNISNIRHVFLYHQPFNLVEFNQMSGRAGRNGEKATIHVLFGSGDAKINEMILQSSAPNRDDMVVLYRLLKQLQEEQGAGFEITNSELVQKCTSLASTFSLDERGVSAGISIFKELGFVQSEGHGAYRKLTVKLTQAKANLTDSVRYLEGLDELADFGEFKEWVLTALPEDLLQSFNRPILPSKMTDETA